jgi:Zn-dependent protease
MSWSFRIARVAGIDIKLHVTFVLILLLGAVQWGAHAGGPGAVAGAIAMALLFVCVALHELGHSLVAIRFGVPVREIILWPLGGVAMMTRNPSRPLHELLISLAGPSVNVVIAAALFVPLLLTGTLFEVLEGIQQTQQLQPTVATIVVWLFIANVMLAGFNLLPALPMDGGRVLRAALAMFVEGSRATQIAGRIGQGMALLMGIAGLVIGNLILVLIAVFVFFVASRELGESRVAPVLRGWRAGHVYDRHGISLAPGDSLSRVVSLLLSSHQHHFPVVHGETLHGVVCRDDVLRSLQADPRDRYVTEVMKRQVLRVPADAPLSRVREAMAERGAVVVAVTDDGEFLGLLSSERLNDVYTLLRHQPPVRDPSRAAA